LDATDTKKVEPFNPPKFRCRSCGCIVYSRWEGEFAACSCFKNAEDNKGIAVDYTRYYGRHIGNPASFEEITE